MKAKWNKMNRHLKNDLEELIFKCQNKECGEELSHGGALEHLKDCEHALRPCSQGCGYGILNKDMKFHIENQCSKTKATCLSC